MILQDDIEYLAKIDAEINKFQKKLASTVSVTKGRQKLQDAEQRKLNVMKSDRVLMQQDHDIRKRIEDFDIAITQTQTRMLQLNPRAKENSDNGIEREPGLGDEMMEIITSIHPLCAAKKPMKEELYRVRRERKELEKEMQEGPW